MKNIVRLLVWRNKFEKRKAVKRKIGKELIPTAWHPTKRWDWCLLKNEKNKVEPIFTDNTVRKF